MKRSMIYTMLFAIALLSLQTLQAMPRFQDKVIYWQQPTDFKEYQKIPRIDYGTKQSLYAITSGHENLQQIRLTMTDLTFNLFNASLTTNVNPRGVVAANKISDIRYDAKTDHFVVLAGMDESQYSLVTYNGAGTLINSVFIDQPATSDIQNSTLLIPGNGYYYIQSNSFIDCYNPTTNAVIWRQTLSESFLTNFTIFQGYVYCIGVNRNTTSFFNIYQLNATTGALVNGSRIYDPNSILRFPNAVSRRMMAITINDKETGIYVTMGLDSIPTTRADQIIGIFRFPNLDITTPPQLMVYQGYKPTEGVHDIMFRDGVYIAGEDFLGIVNPTTLIPVQFRSYAPTLASNYWFTIPNELFLNRASAYPSVLAFALLTDNQYIGHYIFEALTTNECKLNEIKTPYFSPATRRIAISKNALSSLKALSGKPVQVFINEFVAPLCIYDQFKPDLGKEPALDQNQNAVTADPQAITNDNDNIYVGKQLMNSNFTIYTIQAGRAMEGTISGSEISLSNLVSGSYILVIRKTDGNVVSYKFNVIR